MLSGKDHTKMTRDELVAEQKKLTSQRTTIPLAVLIGAVIGVAVWSATHQGGFILTVLLLIAPFLLGSIYSKRLKSIKAEISRRNTVR